MNLKERQRQRQRQRKRTGKGGGGGGRTTEGSRGCISWGEKRKKDKLKTYGFQ